MAVATSVKADTGQDELRCGREAHKSSRPNQNGSSLGFVLGFMRRRSLALKTVGLRERDSIEEEARKSEI